MNAEFERISNAIAELSSFLEVAHDVRVDPDQPFERAQSACEQCAQPTRDALLIVLCSIACAVMYQPKGPNPELAIMARAVMKVIPPVRSQNYAYKMGHDCEMNGATEENCHFSIFSSKENTASWEAGKRAAAAEKEGK